MELNPKVFLAHERGLKAGAFPVSPFLPFPSSTLLLSSSLLSTACASPHLFASITIDYPHFRLRAAFCNSGCRITCRLSALRYRSCPGEKKNRQPNYVETKPIKPLDGICCGRKYGRTSALRKKFRILRSANRRWIVNFSSDNLPGYIFRFLAIFEPVNFIYDIRRMRVTSLSRFYAFNSEISRWEYIRQACI